MAKNKGDEPSPKKPDPDKHQWYVLVRTWKSEPGTKDVFLMKKDGIAISHALHMVKANEDAAELTVAFLRGLGVRIVREDREL